MIKQTEFRVRMFSRATQVIALALQHGAVDAPNDFGVTPLGVLLGAAQRSSAELTLLAWELALALVQARLPPGLLNGRQ